MSDVVIRVENLSKEYRLGTISHGTLYRDIQSGWAKLRGTEDPNTRIGAVNREQLNNTNDRFCALKDVSFDVRQGEIVGIIGRNGAGKSTLLKIISRVTAPTNGTIKIKGRVASLLEVGTGFHPELTGMENIFLNGAILGMHKWEIEQKFDEIIKFADIDKFIDTPVKRYSSGMYVRLAFAVAAHLEPEILVVDEVLAVGDISFQNKCLGKMQDVAEGGRTVLFVSHNLAAIRRLCPRTILFDNGRIICDKDTGSVVDFYVAENQNSFANKHTTEYYQNLSTSPIFKLINFRIYQEKDATLCLPNFVSSKEIFVEIIYEVYETKKLLNVGFNLCDIEEMRILESWHNCEDPHAIVHPGHYVSTATIPANYLVPMKYMLKIYAGIWEPGEHFFKEPIKVEFQIYSDYKSNMVYGIRPIGFGFKVMLPISWNTDSRAR